MKVKEESEKVGLKLNIQNFPGSPVVENLPANAGEMGSIPGPGRSHMLQDLSSCATTAEPAPGAHDLQQEKPSQLEKPSPQLESRPHSYI